MQLYFFLDYKLRLNCYLKFFQLNPYQAKHDFLLNKTILTDIELRHLYFKKMFILI